MYRKIDFTKRWDEAPNDDVNNNNPAAPNRVEPPTFTCPSAPAGRTASKKRGVIDYMPCTELKRASGTNPYTNYPLTFHQPFPKSDPTYVGVLGHNVWRRVSDIGDGTSNTMLVGEDAGQNQRWWMGRQVLSGDALYDSFTGVIGAWPNPNNRMSIGGTDPNDASSPMGPCPMNCRNVDELYSFHTGGANMVMADGAVRFLRSSVKLDHVIAVVTRSNGEVLPADLY